MRLTQTRSIFFLAAILSVSPVLARAPRLSQVERAKLDPRLVRTYAEGSASFRVIARLKGNAATRIPIAPRGFEQPRARTMAVRHLVGREVDAFQRSLSPADFKVNHTYHLWPFLAVTVSRAGLARLADDPDVVRVSLDEVWHAKTATAPGLSLIHADVMHDMGYTGAGTAVAVIDTGIDYNNPALGGGPIPNGKIVYGKDTADKDGDPMDCGEHGTAVASIAAGLPYQWSDGKVFAGGVAPGATILAYKASRDSKCGSFYTSDVIDAIEDVIDQRDTYNVVAINLSIGGQSHPGPCDSASGDLDANSYSTAIDDAVKAGIAVLVASGNENKKDQLDVPACVTNAISVGSVYNQDFPFASFQWSDGNGGVLCTDTNPHAKDVACYSNSDPFLDLLAPADQTTAAAAKGETTSFDGTSAATPYASGSIAVLSQALGDQDPAMLRYLLEVTGAPVTDSANQVTTPLIDLTAAATTPGIGVGQPANVPIPNDASSPAVSTVTINEQGTIKSINVLVKIVHNDPTQLVVTLISPEGVRIKLHDHGPGTVNGTNENMNGIYTDYPAGTQPAESLDSLIGQPAAGQWQLEVLDDDPRTWPGPPPQIVGWALLIDTGSSQGSPPQFATYLIPVAAHLPGAGTPPTFWKTDMRVFNPSTDSTAAFDLYLVPEDADGTTTYSHIALRVPPNTIANLQDVIKTSFGVTNGKGNLVIQAAGTELLATSRTYNSGATSGTFGQFVGADLGISAIGKGDGPVTMLQLASNDAYRTNVGFSEASGHSADVTITLHDGSTGTVIGTPKTYAVKPFSNVQINKIFEKLGAPSSANAYAIVQVTGGVGRITAYATVVDRTTGDAIFVPGAMPSAASSQVIPIVASSPGLNAFWVSDVRVLNAGSSTAQVTLEFRPEKTSPGTFKSVSKTIEAGHVLALDDVLETAFGISNTKGSLRIVSNTPGALLLITSRTYNKTSHGTYGQFVPAVTVGFEGSDHATVIQMDGKGGFHSNAGICNMSGSNITVGYDIKDATGATLGSGTVSLGPYQVEHITHVFKNVGATPTDNARVDFHLDSASGAFTAYGTLVDDTSADAIYIPAMAY
ncbi:MAG: S8 family serine peptidase [Acidobacteria bacterium]|nr:S8 family serine peptidase [Acidobacteriota bacterium]